MSASIVGLGARGPLGFSSFQLAMASRAQLFEPRAVGHLRDRRGREVGVCLTGGLAADLYGYERLLALAAPALAEAWADAAIAATVPLVIALPERGRADDDTRFAADLLDELSTHSGVPLDRSASHLVRSGHTGAAVALEIALDLLRSGAPGVLVGGVDSHLHPGVLRDLDTAGRLHAVDVRGGFIPGEGAAFAMLVPRRREGALGHLLAVHRGCDEEVGHGRPSEARAMAELVVAALGGSGPVSWLLSDVDSQDGRAREWAQLEVSGRLPEPHLHQRLCSTFGGLGAATGATAVSLVCELWRSGRAPAPRALVLLHGDGADRAIVTLQGGG